MKPVPRIFVKTEKIDSPGKKTHKRRAQAYDAEEVLNSYVDKGVIKLGGPTGAGDASNKLPTNLNTVTVSRPPIALRDDLATSANRLSQAVIVESGQGAIFNHKESISPPKGKEEEEEEEEEDEVLVAMAPVPRAYVKLEDEYEGSKITGLQKYKLRDDRDQMHFKHLEVDDCVPDTLVSEIPHWKAVLSYAHTVEAGRKFYEAMSAMVVFTKDAVFPKLEVINRRYIQQFLRAPTTDCAWERPCAIENCESLQLSARLLEKYPHMRKQGLVRGFRCRELLLPNQYVKIRQELKKKGGGKPQKHLTTYPQPCYLCHLRIVNDAYWTLLNRRKQRDKDTGEQRVADAMVILHRFVVVVDMVGEYRMKDMLVGDSEPMGIIGPYPRYNVNNYTPYMDQRGRCAWREADKLVFRLPEQQPDQIDPLDTNSVPTLSVPTTSPVQSTGYPQ